MMNRNDFPEVSEQFDRSVRAALDSLPERTDTKRRFSVKRVLCAGLAAALCIGGTAFAANADHWFPLLFPNGNDAALESYVKTSQDARMTDENENFRLTVDSVLFDESAGTGLISLHLENKKQNSVQPFSVAHRIDGYDKKPDMVWTTLLPCYAAGAGQLVFDVMYGDSGFCGSSFYLDTARSTENDYWLEGAFSVSQSYEPGEPLRLEALDPGGTTDRADGQHTAETVLSVDLPEFQQMPYLKSENGDITLSQIGLRLYNADMYCTVDEVDKVSVQMKDGTSYIVMDESADIDRTLYTLGFSSQDDSDRIDTEIAVLAQPVSLENVKSVTINDVTYAMAYR